jgi:hypothetical protein
LFRNRIVINPSSTLIARREKANDYPIIPIYFEKRRYKEIGNWGFLGESSNVVAEMVLEDF